MRHSSNIMKSTVIPSVICAVSSSRPPPAAARQLQHQSGSECNSLQSIRRSVNLMKLVSLDGPPRAYVNPGMVSSAGTPGAKAPGLLTTRSAQPRGETSSANQKVSNMASSLPGEVRCPGRDTDSEATCNPHCQQ